MSDFFKRNLVWIAILLCIAGVVLSIISIPTGNPVFFFIGVVLATPTIGYLVYQVFFHQDQPELDLTPTTSKFSTSNITSIVSNKADVLLDDEITDEDNLEPFYNGYANEQEIDKRLSELTKNERELAVIDLPEIDLPTARQDNFSTTSAIENATNRELFMKRAAVATSAETFTTEIPADLISNIIDDEPITAPITQTSTPEPVAADTTVQPTAQLETYTAEIDNFDSMTDDQTTEETVSLDDPNFINNNLVVMPQNAVPVVKPNLTPIDLTNATVIHINAETVAKRKKRAEEKKNLLAQENLERYLRRYFVETAACFLMDRTIYKDKNGIAPYNKFAVNKNTGLPEYTMSATKGKLYKFATYLIDAERFITHSVLYDDFVTAIEQGVSLSRISETLHPIYRKKFKKDFILNLANREDWDNVMILVYNNYILNNDNFKDIFTHIPFEIPIAYNEENIIDYLKDADLQERFSEKYSAIEEMGVPTFWEAYYICFINSIKQKLSNTQLENAVLREYKKIARALKRADTTRRRQLRKAS